MCVDPTLCRSSQDSRFFLLVQEGQGQPPAIHTDSQASAKGHATVTRGRSPAAEPASSEPRAFSRFPGPSVPFSGSCSGTAWACPSVTQSCPTPCDPMDCSTPGFPVLTVSGSLFKLLSIELVIPSTHFILCPPLLLLSSILPSIRVFPSMWAQQSNRNIQRTCWGALCLPKQLHSSLPTQLPPSGGEPPSSRSTPPPASVFGVFTLGEAGHPAGPHRRPAWTEMEPPLDSRHLPLDLIKLSGDSGSG